MKNIPYFKSLLVVAATASLISTALAQDTMQEVSRAQTDVALNQPSTDDYLLAMARSSKVNMFADATNFSSAEPPIKGDWKTDFSTAKNGRWQGMIGSLFFDLAHERKLSQRYIGSHTFLFWSEPDAVALAREIVTGEKAKASPAFRLRYQSVSAIMKDNDDLSFALIDYFKTARDWDGTNGAPPSDIPLATLPADLRARVLAYSLRQTYNSPFADERAWFNDSIWKEARLQVRKTFPGNAQPELIIGGFRQDGGSKKTPILRGITVLP